MKKFSSVFVLAALTLAGCGRDKVEERYPKGEAKLIRTYSWPGGKVEREQTFYFNGHKEKDAHYRNGALHGEFTDFWHNGQKKSHGKYVEGKKQGEWEFYFNQFTPSSKGVFKDDQKDGPWNQYWENGALRSQGSYRNGNETGVWKEWNAKGELTLVNSCFEANDTGSYASFHANKTPKEDYRCVKGRPTGAYARKDPDGAIVERGAFDSLGRKDGVWEAFHGDGSKASHASYRGGAQVDSSMAWYEGGGIKERGFFQDGTGELLGYDSLGHRLIERRHLRNGSPEGESRTYFPDGKPRSLVVYKDGLPVEMRKWHPNGKLWAEGGFSRGQRNGEWRVFDEHGVPMETSRYKDGIMDGEQLFYDSLGRLVRTQRYEHGYPAAGKIPSGLLGAGEKKGDGSQAAGRAGGTAGGSAVTGGGAAPRADSAGGSKK
jgi:antitoxin component YwqK of YwqJK toxin-antitoxin module